MQKGRRIRFQIAETDDLLQPIQHAVGTGDKQGLLGDGDSVTPPIDADEGSYDGGTRTIDVGDQNNANNSQLDLAADRVWALVFTVRMQ